MENILFRSERLVPSWNLLLPTVLLYYHFVPLNVNPSTILPFMLEANQLKCELNRPSDTSPRHWLRFVMPYFDGISYPFLLKFLQFLLGVSKDSWNFNQRFLSMPTITLSKISGARRRFLFKSKKGGMKKWSSQQIYNKARFLNSCDHFFVNFRSNPPNLMAIFPIS